VARLSDAAAVLVKALVLLSQSVLLWLSVLFCSSENFALCYKENCGSPSLTTDYL
jgi:hypothetical protein